ncbi:hypothetical protein NMY22_g9893 [Coprinellus aureogranulatus]|nr:hypothetical protein NMY22_g9893 [Coprinellus aureogranulatus]
MAFASLYDSAIDTPPIHTLSLTMRSLIPTDSLISLLAILSPAQLHRLQVDVTSVEILTPMLGKVNSLESLSLQSMALPHDAIVALSSAAPSLRQLDISYYAFHSVVNPIVQGQAFPRLQHINILISPDHADFTDLYEQILRPSSALKNHRNIILCVHGPVEFEHAFLVLGHKYEPRDIHQAYFPLNNFL